MPKVLLVEDNDLNRDMLSRRLERRAYTVAPACDGAEAIRLAQNLLPDIILMDISLPEVDGWQATRYLKSQAGTRRIPIIALTAHAMPEDRRKAAEAGCDEFETKPVDLASLIAKMECLLAGQTTGFLDSASPALAAGDSAETTEYPVNARLNCVAKPTYASGVCENENRSGTAKLKDEM